MWQPEKSEQVGRSDLLNAFAKSFAAYIDDKCGVVARLRECRRIEEIGYEIVSFDLQISVPQRPVHPILPVETVSVGFASGNLAPPRIVVARHDFPDTPHQNLVPDGQPCVLCIDDRSWQDARSDYTASELLSRIVTWFEKACQGELHGADQPFDPVFAYDTAQQIILRKDAETALERGSKVDVWLADENGHYLLVVPADTSAKRAEKGVGLQIIRANVDPKSMVRIKRSPRNLKRLVELLRDRGLDLVPILHKAALDWLNDDRDDRTKNWCFCIIVALPQINPSTGAVGDTRPTAFFCDVSGGDIGVALGSFMKNDTDVESKVRYVPTIAPNPDWTKLEQIAVNVSLVHVELDATRAAHLADREETDLRRVALIGAGSLGSALAELLTREGLFRWTIIDGDDFLPHNVSRHTLGREAFGAAKATRLAYRITTIRGDAEPRAIAEDVLAAADGAESGKAIDEANLVIDASASVTVSRWLADRASAPRVASAFFTPAGNAAVLMSESADRRTNLRDLEAAYLREVLVNPALQDHHRPGQQMRYTGACRALTNRIPTSSAAVLGGLIAGSLPDASRMPEPTLRIWTRKAEGNIDCLNVSTRTIRMHSAEWSVILPASLLTELAVKRDDALPNETGGSLMGLIDHDAKVISIIHALAAPEDSSGTQSGFTRGKRRLRHRMDEARARSGGLVRYIGEWHSHPPGHSALPSSIDRDQIVDLSSKLEIDGLPAVSLIIAEGEICLLIGEAHHER